MSEYACKCLNVRVRPGSAAQQQQQRPEQSASSAAAAAPRRDPFVPATVAADGISVVHNQLTQRIRSRARPLSSEADELQRCMSLRCLICGMTVYRVSQVIPPDMDAPEGPVHTADDWVEDTALTSNDGLIEVSLDCLDAAKVKDAERSPQYSPFFRVLIPPAPTRPDLPQVPHSPFAADGEAPSLPSPPLTPHLFEETEAEHARPYRALPLSQPLFPPAPFTPSHPVFVHLSSVALRRSHEIRQAADDFLSRLIADKLQEVTREEAALRAQVQALWATFRAAQADTEPASAPSMQAAAAPAVSSPIRGRDETFAPPAARRTASPPRSSSRPKSALSASLSTSSFHHPRASSSRSNSTTSSSFSSTRPLDDTHSVVRGSFRRNLSEDKDVATSFKYSLDIAAEMEKRTGMRTKRRDASAEEEEKSAADGASVQSPPPVMTKQATARSPPPKKTKAENKDEAAEAERLSPGKAKVKRKVTFDIQTPVKEEAPANGHAGVDDAVIFDLEDETGGERFEPFGEPSTTEALPLNEPPPPHVPRRPSNKRAGSSESGLPQSFSLLRPASLPKPSLLRFASSPPGAASKLSSPLSLQTQSPPQAQAQGKTNGRAELPEPLTPREEALARLVAADTPSHRAAWKKDGKAWEVFNGRSSIRDPLDDETDEEDEEDTLGPLPSPRSNGKQIPRTGESDWDPPVAASLPIAIDTTRNRTPSGGLTYQPKTSLSDNYGQVVPALHAPGSKGGTYTSPAALRRAAYAERDIARSMDPGALDFLQGEDDEDEGEDGVDAGSRGKQNALKILKARSQLPSEGMWRSLAT